MLFKDLHAIPNQNVHLREKVSSHLLGLHRVGHIISVTTRPVIVLTDSKPVIQFFHKKWFLRSYGMPVILPSNSISPKAHLPGKMNTTADFQSRLELDPNEKINLKCNEDFPIRPTEINLESAGIAQFFRQNRPTRDYRKRSGSAKKKHNKPYRLSAQSSQCCVITLIIYTKIKRLRL